MITVKKMISIKIKIQFSLILTNQGEVVLEGAHHRVTKQNIQMATYQFAYQRPLTAQPFVRYSPK